MSEWVCRLVHSHASVCKGCQKPTISSTAGVIQYAALQVNVKGVDSQSAGTPGMGTNTHTHTQMEPLYMPSDSKCTLFVGCLCLCSLFRSCSTQRQLWCLTKGFPLVFCVCVSVCLCIWSLKGSNPLSVAGLYPGHIRTQVSQAF